MNEKGKSGTMAPGDRAKHLKQFFVRIAEMAGKHGLSGDAAEALIGIDASAFALRRRMMKRELSITILSALNLNIEHAEFEALTALARLVNGVGNAPRRDVTIGDIAEELSIDPSRASRLVAGLVQKGYVRRAATQDDGRKSILALSGASQSLMEAFLTLKWRAMIEVFSSWSEKDIADFERLFSHYAGSFADLTGRIPSDIVTNATLAREIKAALLMELASREPA